jgi:hypothetical protein
MDSNRHVYYLTPHWYFDANDDEVSTYKKAQPGKVREARLR